MNVCPDIKPISYILAKDIVNIILEYYGRIKYKNGKYINIIHKHDERYNICRPIICKKIQIIKKIDVRDSCFYFEFGFDIDNRVGLCYDYKFTYPNEFEICYYDLRNGWEQIRTYI